MPTSVVEGFSQLFEGRRDAYGADSGGCVRVYHEREWQPYLWEKHLTGEQPIGVYPTVKRAGGYDPKLHPVVEQRFWNEWSVKWGCIDFDRKSENHPSFDYETEEECHIAAVNLQRVLAALGVTSWIERTRSCGRHVWIFCEQWVLAGTVRRSLLVACSVASVSTREVNPKQETLAEGQLGNYVRLPYPGALLGRHTTQVVMKSGYYEQTLGLDQFVRDALAARTSPQTLEAIASRYVSTKGSRAIPSLEFDFPAGDLLTLYARLSATGRSVFRNGPNDGDRSRGMVYLARQAKLSGLTPSEALTLLRGAHWNKYRNRADEEKQLRDIVERAWA